VGISNEGEQLIEALEKSLFRGEVIDIVTNYFCHPLYGRRVMAYGLSFGSSMS
jgi:hypothetical protein